MLHWCASSKIASKIITPPLCLTRHSVRDHAVGFQAVRYDFKDEQVHHGLEHFQEGEGDGELYLPRHVVKNYHASP